jgi:acetylornithine deacetylase/succinyl-diaminopimelate desuccinylase-like protein
MNCAERTKRVFDQVSEARLVALARDIIAIPSPNFGEAKVADYLADYMTDMGLAVEMMEVSHPNDGAKKTKQPIGRLKGDGGGPCLMLNGHMDTNVVMSGWTVDPYAGKFEDGWIWGLGAQDDKGGIAAAITAVDSVIRSGVKLNGDVLVCPVATHKLGGTGTRTLMKNGVHADLCINLEHAANTIGSVIVGSIRVKIKTTTPGLFFRFTPEARAKYFNAIEQQCELIRRFGTSLGTTLPGNWLRFTPHPDLPNFPMIRYDWIHKEHYGRDCEMLFQVRTVPGMSLVAFKEDVNQVLAQAKREIPMLDFEVTIPADGPDDPFYMEPTEVPRDHPLVVALAEGQELASGHPAEIGGVERIGNFGDGNVLAAYGIPTVQYGPGNIKNYPEWPAADERVEVCELMETTKAVAHVIAKLCG